MMACMLLSILCCHFQRLKEVILTLQVSHLHLRLNILVGELQTLLLTFKQLLTQLLNLGVFL